MKRVWMILLALSMPLMASGQGSGFSGNVAVVSLIGNQLTVDTYRRKVGTMFNTNAQEVVPTSSPALDEFAIAAATKAIYPLLVDGAKLSTVAVPAPGSALDPNLLVVNGAVSGSNALVAALKDNGFSHLFAITKYRGAAKLQMSDATVGSGQLQGLGFYIDNDFETKRGDTGATARGFIAPYAYIKLLLIDLKTLDVQGEKVITTSAVRSAARNETGLSPWGAMSSEEKVEMLQALMRDGITEAVPLVFQKKP
jgi:hypothetical protein